MKKLIHWIRFNTAIPKNISDRRLNSDKVMGIIVSLTNDEKQEEYEIITSGPISTGPMGQFIPSRSFLCRRPIKGEKGHYDYWYFRKDSLKFVK